MILLEANWNRPLLAWYGLLATIIICVGIWALVKIKGW